MTDKSFQIGNPVEDGDIKGIPCLGIPTVHILSSNDRLETVGYPEFARFLQRDERIIEMIRCCWAAQTQSLLLSSPDLQPSSREG